MAYVPIEDYGIIGDLHTVALVGKHGSIDWFCFPSLDSPSVFAALLDDAKGGRFQIAPLGGEVTRKQLYFPDTNVLITRFLSDEGVGEICDLMPVATTAAERDLHRLIRRVSVVRGSMRFRVTCQPAFDYARTPHVVAVHSSGATFRSPELSLTLLTEVPLTQEADGATATFALKAGHAATFLLQGAQVGQDPPAPLSEAEYEDIFRATVAFWQHWLSSSNYRGRWWETVNRSALVLKLLTFEPTGAVVAAPTSSLPGGLGGGRTWDYRYTWIRDASFTLYALLRIGFTREGRHFMDWLQARSRELQPDGSLQVMYGIDGRHELAEQVVPHLEGYRGMGPVRIGNDAYKQLQLDIYGELMDSVYLYNKYGTPISYDLWVNLRRLLNWVCDHWHEPDEGIWEVRGGRQHFVYSKLMCWVALDRGLRLADKRSFPADRERWLRARDTIYEEIMTQGWNPSRRAFVQAYGSRALDASTLLMPLIFFLSPTDPRMLSTLEAVQRELVSDSLVHRYDPTLAPDGLPGLEGTFCICTFWLVEALTRAGRLDEARLIFEKMLGYANHLGLYAEQIGPHGEALGNFPQAFTHLSLISAAHNLDRALNRRRGEGGD
ncbi:MAG TPA: glycoside hydrolase family 15 protein [Candidatus Methylomirabilis sp.]|nr:glycoside hydrolase family 15 protein [Candidatus Methylomirabilis sp.]